MRGQRRTAAQSFGKNRKEPHHRVPRPTPSQTLVRNVATSWGDDHLLSSYVRGKFSIIRSRFVVHLLILLIRLEKGFGAIHAGSTQEDTQVGTFIPTVASYQNKSS